MNAATTDHRRMTRIIIGFAVVALIVHLLTIHRYGYFRDELYYIACARHLDFGYVDLAPLSAFLLRIELILFGSSLFALRIFPAVASALTVALAGILACELGGRVWGLCSPARVCSDVCFFSRWAIFIRPMFMNRCFGRARGLPPALSGHQNYFYWGPGNYTGEIMIVLDDDATDEREQFRSVEDRGLIESSPWAMPWEQRLHIFVCRDLKIPLRELWPKVRVWL
jgi:hypothetical protein